MATKLDRQLRSNDASLQKVGFSAKDLALGQVALMDKAIAKLAEYKQGADQNIAAQVMFGRSGADALKLLKLGAEGASERAQALQTALQSAVSPQAAAQAKAHKISMNELGMAFEAIKKVIGEAVLPYLTKFADWFVTVAPTIITTMKSTMRDVVEGGFSAAEGFINFVVSVVNGVYTLYSAWQDMKWLFGGDKNNEGLASFRKALDNLDTFKKKAIATINDVKAAVLGEGPPAPEAKNKGTRSAANLINTDSNTANDAKAIDGQIAVMRQGFERKKMLIEADLEAGKKTLDQRNAAVMVETEREYQAELALYEQKLKIANLEPALRQKIDNQISALKAKHDTEMLALDLKSIGDQRKAWEGYLGTLTGAFNGQLRGLLAGTTSWSQAFKNVLGDLLIKFIGFCEDLAVKWAAKEIADTTASTTGAAQRAAGQEAAAATALGPKIARFTSDLTALGAQTFAGIMANLAPILGPAAVGPAAAGQATVMAQMAAVPKLAEGTNFVQSDGLAMIHRGEAVVPAQANGPWQGGGRDVAIHLHVSALDGHSVKNWFRNGGGNQLANLLGDHLGVNPTIKAKYST